ncbi:actin cytoskeleton-regulatory complex protein END3-domain-containing protein [Scheffersomyces coipomensis]|uniref:actin cytoskeleton-regulatory complex protein END3-domain-containing protein n=1 Tax=Scheffersomyces coipomensis TaxID=1788519 RepID=UPI00315E02A5
MPKLEDWEIKKYWEIFQGLKPSNNKLTGEQVSPVLKNSKLSTEQLSKVWELSDIDSDGKLDFEEFCITMRLIFDSLNGNITSIPNELPNWLIPSSKSHLIAANKAVNSNQNLGIDYDDDEDEDDKLSDNFEWYISPTDKATYEAIYNSNSDSFGRVKFDSLNGLYNSLSKVPRADISSAWNLVNPKSFETIDKDQVLVFLHILNQRENGKRVPRGVPASLRATFSKEVPNYDLQKPAQAVSSSNGNNGTDNGKKSFASSYLTKITGSSNPINGTDFSSTEGTDWEEVRLRRELTDLENVLNKASSGLKQEKSNDNELAIVKHEFEQLLKYKQSKLSQSSVSGSTSNGKQLSEIKGDIELIESHVSTLQDYLTGKQSELSQLQQEIQALKSS